MSENRYQGMSHRMRDVIERSELRWHRAREERAWEMHKDPGLLENLQERAKAVGLEGIELTEDGPFRIRDAANITTWNPKTLHEVMWFVMGRESRQAEAARLDDLITEMGERDGE